MFGVVLIVFGCMLTNNQVWRTNLGQRGSKLGFFRKNLMGSREETQKLGSLFWCISPGVLQLAIASCSVQQLMFLVFQVL